MKINANEIIEQSKTETGLSDLGEPLFLEGPLKIGALLNRSNLFQF